MPVGNETRRSLGLGKEPEEGDKTALTAKDGATVDGTYGSEEEGVIKNNRTRIEEIETALKNLGVLK